MRDATLMTCLLFDPCLKVTQLLLIFMFSCLTFVVNFTLTVSDLPTTIFYFENNTRQMLMSQPNSMPCMLFAGQLTTRVKRDKFCLDTLYNIHYIITIII